MNKHSGEFHDYENWYWRIGTSVGRTIYAMIDRDGKEKTRNDILIGMMDTRAIAKAAVEHHNQEVAYRSQR